MSNYGIRNRPDFVNYVSSLAGTRNDSQAHSTSSKRYYSSIDGEIYFGDYYIDEIVSIRYSIEQNNMPLYGYNSYTFDEMAIGSRIINGQFTINFTKANYLTDLLEKLEKSSAVLTDETAAKEDDGEEDSNAETIDQTGGSRYTTTNYQNIKQSKRPLWYTGFDIDIMFGRGTTKIAKTEHVMLEGVYILSSMVNLDPTGQPVSETYTFIARDVRTATA